MVIEMRSFRITVGLTLLAILLLSVGAGAVPVEKWNKTFAESDDTTVSDIQQTSDGGYIFVGSITNHSDPVNHHKYAWVVKIGANGNEDWSRSYVGEISSYSARISDPVSGERTVSGTESTAHANAVQQVADGGYAIIGGYMIGGGAARVIWLINIDANGNERWNKTFGGIGYGGYAYSLEQTSDSGYIITGSKGDIFDKDAWLIKTDANGNEEWNKTFGGKSNFHFVQQTSDGGYILAGGYQKYMESGPISEGWIIKTDANGNEQWNKTVTYSPGFINQTSDGYILANSTGWYKVDTEGNEQWNKTFRKTEKDVAFSYKQASDSGFILGGQTSISSQERGVYTDAWLSKIDSNGNEQWNLTFGKPGSNIVSVEQTLDSGYILAGNQLSSGVGSNTWLIKLSKEPVETTKVPTTSPTDKTEISPTQKGAGFEVVLAIAILSIIYLLRRKTR
jgi:hypothetical protein